MTGYGRPDRSSLSGRRRGPLPPVRLGILFALFLALLVYQRDYLLLVVAGLGLILYGFLARRRK